MVIHEKVSEFEGKINQNIDAGIDKLLVNLKEKDQEKAKRAEELRKLLKREITGNEDYKYTQDFDIQWTEWITVFEELKKEHGPLLQEFGITGPEMLRNFIGVIDYEFHQFVREPGLAIKNGLIDPKNLETYLEMLWLDPHIASPFLILRQKESLAQVLRFPIGKELILRAGYFSPEIMMYFEKWKDSPIAIKLLEECIYSSQGRDDLKAKALKDLRSQELISLNEYKRLIGLMPQRSSDVEFIEKLLPSKEKFSLSNFFQDRSVRGVSRIKDEWIYTGDEYNEMARHQLKLLVCRNLHFKGLPITEANVKKENRILLKKRLQYKNISLFRDRSVMVLAHNETLRDGRDEEGNPLWEIEYEIKEFASNDVNQFGKKGTLEKIENDMGKGRLDVRRAEREFGKLKEQKKTILKEIATKTPPFTFVFTGHGSPDSIFLSDGQMPGNINQNPHESEKTIKITYIELAKAIIERKNNFPRFSFKDNPDIFLFLDCYSSDFMRNLYAKIGNKGPKPIAIAASEYGQVSYGRSSSKYDSSFFEDVLGQSFLDSMQENAKNFLKYNTPNYPNKFTLGTIMDREFMSDSDPVIYMPSDDNESGIYQLSQKSLDPSEIAT